MNPNQRFAELAGVRYAKASDNPAFSNFGKDDPDFTDAREVLKVLFDNGELVKFLSHINVWQIGFVSFIVDYILDETGKLRDLAIEWMEGKRERQSCVRIGPRIGDGEYKPIPNEKLVMAEHKHNQPTEYILDDEDIFGANLLGG